MAVSDKLTYLNTTKGKIKDTINLTGANILSTDTFRSYAIKLKNGLVDIINNGIDTLYSNFPKVTAEGTEIVLNNTYEAPMKLDYYGDTQQDSYSGNQLIDFGNMQVSSNTTYFFTNDILNIDSTSGTYTNASYNITDLYKNNAGKNLKFTYKNIDVTNQYGAIVQLVVKYNDSTPTTYPPFLRHDLVRYNITIPDDTSNIQQVIFIVYPNNTNTSQSASVTIEEPMLQFGTETKTYEPFVGGKKSPSPDYPQSINVVTGSQSISVKGKNLFDKDNSNTLNSYINDVSGAILSSTKSRTIYIPCKSNTTYTISKQYETARFVVGTTTEIPTNNVVCTQTIINSTATSITITTGANDKYLCAFIYHSDNDSPKTLDDILKIIQIEENSSATTYQPFKSATYTVDLGNIELCNIGDYQDFIKKSSGKNLFDKDNANVIGASFKADSGSLLSSVNAKTLYIPCKSNTTYTISKISSQRFAIGTTNTTPASGVTLLQKVVRDANTSGTITTDNNANYLCVYYFLNGTDTLTEQQILDTIQIEENNQVTDYEPFGKIWYKKANIGKVVLDGSEEWPTASATDGVRFVCNNYTNAKIPQSLDTVGDLLSDKFISVTANQTTTSYNGIAIAGSGKFVIYYDVAKNYNSNQFKTWLSSNNIIVYYALATPTYTEITDTSLINQLEAIKKSYEDKTYISVSGSLPSILGVTALSKE